MDTQLEILLRIEELLKTTLKVQLQSTSEHYLSDKRLRQLYDQTGKKSIKQLSKEFGFSAGKISGLWQKWEEVGLLIKGTDAKYKKVL
ncbi:MAG TPA: hypothetical protein VFO76_06970 [Candidatus Kapabacteria bacterium]|nr:hypothetical protein [Candidatus Kapabacteria bacterium]